MRAMSFEAAIAAFLVTCAGLALLLSPAGRRMLLDRPNDRSLHEHAIPRSGGIAIAAGVGVGAALAPHVPAEALLVAAGLAAVSLVDDVAPLPALLRLGVHLTAAGIFLAIGLPAVEPWLFIVLLLAVAWYANLFNFMDGSDGLAGGMAVIGFGAYALAGHMTGQTGLAQASACIAVSALAFIFANFPPARLFMGDAGSVPLGFLAGALGVEGWRAGAWPAWFPLLVFAPFVGDATLTLLRRALRGERIWQAHRSHYYQRLVQMGAGHRGTALIEYAAMALCAGAALFAREAPGIHQAVVLGVAAAALAASAAWIDALWVRHLARGRRGSA